MFRSMMVGLGRLIEYPEWTAVAILPVDHPLVRPQTVVALSNATASAAIPSFDGKHGHPICMRRSVVELIIDGTLTGPTLREVLKSVNAVDLPVDDPGIMANCNTPEALARALEGHHSRRNRS
jgi:CTP:molybdopterin cytidylyltransferase MocA